MERTLTIIFVIVSILMIAVVLLQSAKAEGASQALTGGVDLFADRKERGTEVIVTRITYVLGFAFCILSFLLSVIV